MSESRSSLSSRLPALLAAAALITPVPLALGLAAVAPAVQAASNPCAPVRTKSSRRAANPCAPASTRQQKKKAANPCAPAQAGDKDAKAANPCAPATPRGREGARP